MTEKMKTAYNVTLFDDADMEQCSTLVEITSRDYDIFCKIVEYVQEVIKNDGDVND